MMARRVVCVRFIESLGKGVHKLGSKGLITLHLSLDQVPI